MMASLPARKRLRSSRRGRIRIRRSLVAAAIVVLLGALAAHAAPDPVPATGDPYRYLLPTDDVFRWPTGESIDVWLDPSASARTRVLRTAFDRASRNWNHAAVNGEYRISKAERLADAEVAFTWSDRASTFDTSRCPADGPGSAVTAFCVSAVRPGRLQAFPAAADAGPHDRDRDSKRNPEHDSERDPEPVRVLVVLSAALSEHPERLDRVVAHELGHVLGIGGHSPEPSDLMWPGRLRTATPTASDRATVRALYRARPEIRP